eukprot:CAMPEP_0202427462 /NCGR_PEP_ID=MMETSP1345-20130828/1684_1 /ASSEMBLY_ACC=CAM_ASM_000843 /TAXON_ID=342563 /ORGANISM="Fabrea Fabrea salina" /LENGTH=453 /DNA_ID=CAMNT_0049038187 /DNA_START=106 /DNA_END=1467 /DNA_ORIENTATION=+
MAGGLLTFKQFMELQHDPIPPFEAQHHYEEYKKDYERKQLETFFGEHKDEHWFIEKYDPVVSQKWQEERHMNAKVSHRTFIEGARSSAFEGLKLRDNGTTVDKISGPPYYGFDPNSMTLFLKTIPVNISRWDLLSVVKTSPGFVSLSMSEPLKSQGFSRFAWVLYDSEQRCNESLELLTNKTVVGDFKLSPVRSQSSSRKEVHIQPPQPLESLEADWKQSARLISCLDREKGIQENPLLVSQEKFASMSEEEKENQLDLQLLYLRKVHAFCYYCLEEYDDERMLAAKCGPAHIRSRYDPSALRSPEFDEQVETRLNKKVTLQKYDKDSDAKLAEKLLDFENKNAIEEEEMKVRCAKCKKLFRGIEFMKKHLHNKHPEEIEKVVDERLKEIMLENYLNDPDKLMNQIQYAGEGFRGARRPPPRQKKSSDLPYEDLDDPSKFQKSSRKVIDYSDI